MKLAVISAVAVIMLASASAQAGTLAHASDFHAVHAQNVSDTNTDTSTTDGKATAGKKTGKHHKAKHKGTHKTKHSS